MKKYLNIYLVTIVAFTFVALTLPINGYNSPLMLLVLFPLLFRETKKIQIDKNDWYLISLLACTFLYFLLNLLLRQEPLRLFDKNIRILLFIGILLFFLKYHFNAYIINSSILLGAFTSGFFAIYEKSSTGVARVGEHINPIQFGTFSMLLSLLSVVIFNYYLIEYCKYKNKKRLIWIGTALISSLLGFYASISSGSRGGWLSMPLFVFVVYKQYSDNLNIKFRIKAVILMVFLVALIGVYKEPKLNVASRVLEAQSNLNQYFEQGLIETSVGARLEMWRIAIGLGIEKPIFGWGHTGYQDEIKKKVEAKQTSKLLLEFNEPHNQFLDAFAKYGLSGLFLVLTLYLWPMTQLMRQYRKKLGTQQSLHALMGGVSMLAFFDFSLTHSFINKNGGMMVFLFCLTLFWALSKKPVENEAKQVML
jgi:O-antigen ligase